MAPLSDQHWMTILSLFQWTLYNVYPFSSQGLIPLATLGLALSGSLTGNVQSSQEKSMDNSEQLDQAEAVLKSGIHSFVEKFGDLDQSQA